MRRALLASLFLGALSIASGCSLCCAPHDYCGPVWESEGNCDFCYRHNSATYSEGVEGEYIEEAAPETLVRRSAQLRPVPDRRYTPHVSDRTVSHRNR